MRAAWPVALSVVLALGAAVCRHLSPRPPYAVVLVRDGEKAPDARVPVLAVEVVWKDTDRQRGLGGRAFLPEDHGMLFVYGDDKPRNFWMKDCLIGLDIAYLRADGTIELVATLPPAPPEGSGKVIPQQGSVAPVRYVLEANAGWFLRHGVTPSDKVDVRSVTAGVVPE